MIAWRASQVLKTPGFLAITSCPQRLNVNSKLGYPLTPKTIFLQLNNVLLISTNSYRYFFFACLLQFPLRQLLLI